MAGRDRILLLAGSMEARRIAEALLASGFDVLAVTSEAPKVPEAMPAEWVLMEDVTEPGLRAVMAGCRAVVDASHAFDRTLSVAGYAAAQAEVLPIIRFSRTAWELEAEGWQRATDVAAAMALVPARARVFSATGWGSLPDYAGFPGARLLLRQTQAHDRVPPFDFVELIFGEAPFTADSEAALFRSLRVDLLICRNLGGRASRPKLDAALALGLPVILIDRPVLPALHDEVASVAEVLEWTRGL